MNAYRTFDARVRAAARAATPSDRLLLLAEDLAVAVLSLGRFRPEVEYLTSDERRAFLVEKLLLGALGRRMGLARALLFLGAGCDPQAPGVFFLPVAARRVEKTTHARDPLGREDTTAARYAALYAVVHRKKRRGAKRVREELSWTVLRCPDDPALRGERTARSDWRCPELALAVYYDDALPR